MPSMFSKQSRRRPISIVQLPVTAVTPPVLLSGATEDQSITASSGTYSGAAPITVSRQWQISDDGVSGWASAGGTDLVRTTLQAGEVGKWVRMAETPSNPVGVGTTQYTGTAQVVAANPPGSGVATLTLTPTPGISSYEVAWGAEYDAETFTQTYNSVTDTITVTGLESGTLYFKIRALPDGDWYSLGPVVIA